MISLYRRTLNRQSDSRMQKSPKVVFEARLGSRNLGSPLFPPPASCQLAPPRSPKHARSNRLFWFIEVEICALSLLDHMCCSLNRQTADQHNTIKRLNVVAQYHMRLWCLVDIFMKQSVDHMSMCFAPGTEYSRVDARLPDECMFCLSRNSSCSPKCKLIKDNKIH